MQKVTLFLTLFVCVTALVLAADTTKEQHKQHNHHKELQAHAQPHKDHTIVASDASVDGAKHQHHHEQSHPVKATAGHKQSNKQRRVRKTQRAGQQQHKRHGASRTAAAAAGGVKAKTHGQKQRKHGKNAGKSQKH